MSGSSFRPLLLSVLASTIAGVLFAMLVGGPQALIFLALGPMMVCVALLDRAIEKRQQAKQRLRELGTALQASPAPVEFIYRQPLASTWWQVGLDAPSPRLMRLGQRRRRAREIVAWGGSREVTELVAVDAQGGIELHGPPAVFQAVMLALRLNRARVYAPHEAVPSLVLGVDEDAPSARWVLRIDSRAKAVLTDRVHPEVAPISFEVDVLDRVYEPLVRAMEVPSRTCHLADLELEGQCPHTLIAGMTGSGKTEFLIAWMSQLAALTSADELAIAIIDFKGGGSFERLRSLSHVRHIVTDLEPQAIRAALEGLSAQVEHRERVMREHGVPSISSVPTSSRPPRLLLVVDEYRALIEEYPEFRSALADVAARGRALGMHLVVSSQQFVGLTAETLIANIHTRIVFRISNPAEASQLVGSPAPGVDSFAPGEAIVARPGRGIENLSFEMHSGLPVASFSPGDGDESWREDPPRPLWLEPTLPPRVPAPSRSGVLPTQIPLGTRDNHLLLERESVSWNIRFDGILLCVGADFRARTHVCDVIQAGDPGAERIPEQPHEAWDALARASKAEPVGFLIPNLDSIVARMPPQWREEFVELVIGCAHRSHLAEKPVVLGFAGENSLLSRASVFPSSVLTLNSAQADAFAQTTAQTMAQLRGARLQLYSAPSKNIACVPETPALDLSSDLLVISSRPAKWLRAGVQAISPMQFVSADHNARIVIDGCSPAEVRALRLSEQPLPPPWSGTAFELLESGAFRRVRVPPEVAG